MSARDFRAARRASLTASAMSTTRTTSPPTAMPAMQPALQPPIGGGELGDGGGCDDAALDVDAASDPLAASVEIGHSGMTRDVIEFASPGMLMSSVKAGVVPGVHVQHGSPSSRPLLWPSPSWSALQRVSVHCSPAATNATRNAAGPPAWPVADRRRPQYFVLIFRITTHCRLASMVIESPTCMLGKQRRPMRTLSSLSQGSGAVRQDQTSSAAAAASSTKSEYRCSTCCRSHEKVPVCPSHSSCVGQQREDNRQNRWRCRVNAECSRRA